MTSSRFSISDAAMKVRPNVNLHASICVTYPHIPSMPFVSGPPSRSPMILGILPRQKNLPMGKKSGHINHRPGLRPGPRYVIISKRNLGAGAQKSTIYSFLL